jgi:hypothetical protein
MFLQCSPAYKFKGKREIFNQCGARLIFNVPRKVQLKNLIYLSAFREKILFLSCATNCKMLFSVRNGATGVLAS